MSRIIIILSLMMTAAIATNFVMNVNKEWESFSVFHRDHEYALVGHVIKTLSLFIGDCQEACQPTIECFSFNYRSFFNGTFVCELNRSNKKKNPGSYALKEGYQYSEPMGLNYCSQEGCTEKAALPGGWYRFNSSLFKLVTENKTWTDARQHCQSLGGDLVSFSTQTENIFAFKTFRLDFVISNAVRYRMDGTEQNFSLFSGAAVVDIDNTKAVYFDGVDDHATIPRVNISTTDFTIDLWIKPKAPWEWVNTVIDDYNNGETSFVVFFHYGELAVEMISAVDNSKFIIMKHNGVPLDQWTHVSLAWNRDQKTARLFINAIQKAYKNTTFQNIDLVDNPNPVWKIGARDGANNKYFKGWMRDLIVIPRALSPEDIQKLKDDLSGTWIGLNDIATEGLFQWSDGSPLTFTQSRLTADNTDARNCVMMGNVYLDHAEWSAENCNKMKSFICEKK